MKNKIIPFLYTLIIMLLSIFFINIFYYFNIIGEKTYKIISYIFILFSIIFGSTKFGKNNARKGIISGLIYFFIIFILMFIPSLIAKKLTFFSFIFYLLILLFSVLGSIIGKNKKKEN